MPLACSITVFWAAFVGFGAQFLQGDCFRRLRTNARIRTSECPRAVDDLGKRRESPGKESQKTLGGQTTTRLCVTHSAVYAASSRFYGGIGCGPQIHLLKQRGRRHKAPFAEKGGVVAGLWEAGTGGFQNVEKQPGFRLMSDNLCLLSTMNGAARLCVFPLFFPNIQRHRHFDRLAESSVPPTLGGVQFRTPFKRVKIHSLRLIEGSRLSASCGCE